MVNVTTQIIERVKADKTCMASAFAYTMQKMTYLVINQDKDYYYLSCYCEKFKKYPTLDGLLIAITNMASKNGDL